MTALAYRSHHSTGLGDWIASLLVRAVTYRVIFGLPLPLVLVVGAGALFFMVARRRRRS